MNGSIVSIFINYIKVMDLKRLSQIVKVKIKLFTTYEIIDIRLISFYLVLKREKNYEKKIFKLFQLTYINKIIINYYFDFVKL